jgi:hypothetical protein
VSATTDDDSVIFAFWRGIAPCALPVLVVTHCLSRNGKSGIAGLAAWQAAKAAIGLF